MSFKESKEIKVPKIVSPVTISHTISKDLELEKKLAS